MRLIKSIIGRCMVYSSVLGMIALVLWPNVNIAQNSGFFSSGKRSFDTRIFDREVRRMMSEVGVPGLSLAVICNDKIVYYNAYGDKERGKKENVDDKTAFIGCSLSKSFLVFVAHQLVDEGKLDLDKPLNEYLEYDLLAYDFRYKLITARMILSHSSGIENTQPEYAAETLDIIADPGKKYVYSGEGYHYLAAVIEKITGQTYEEYINKRVIEPLKLENTYLKFKETSSGNVDSERPSNYAVGHLAFGRTNVIKNNRTFPAFGNHFTAEDYAKLILATFDTTRLGVSRINDLVKPVIEVSGRSIYYGPGYELFIGGNDIIVSHGGSCEGYKNHVFYSPVNKIGVVFLSNGDLGNMMASQLCRYAVDLDISPFVDSIAGLNEQYPRSHIPDLLKIYEEQGADAMFVAIEKLKANNKLGTHSLSMLGILFIGIRDDEISKLLFHASISSDVGEPLPHSLLGNVYLRRNEPDSALFCFTKARQLNPGDGVIEADIAECGRRIADLQRRKQLCVQVNAHEPSVIQAEGYNSMKGVDVYGYCVGGIAPGDWMTYRVNVSESGQYSVTFCVASLTGGGSYQVWTDDKLVATVDVPLTGGWENWTSVTVDAYFSAGNQTMKLYAVASGFNIDQMSFRKK